MIRRLAPAMVAVVVSFAAPEADAQIVATQIPAPAEGLQCWSEDINELGDVLVNCHNATAPNSVPFIWSMSTQTTTLIPNAGGFMYCSAINDSRQVLCWKNSGAEHFLWSQDTGVTSLAGYQTFELNDLGEVTAYQLADNTIYFGVRRADGSFVSTGAFVYNPTRAFDNLSRATVQRFSDGAWGYWSPTSGFTALAAQPFADRNNNVYGMNDAGQLAAQSYAWLPDDTYVSRATTYSPLTGWTVLTHPSHLDAALSWANDINVLGQASGSIWTDQTEEAFVWPNAQTAVGLGQYAGFNTVGMATNASGQVAGGGYACVNGSCANIAIAWTFPPPVPPPVQKINAVSSEIDQLVGLGELDEEESEALKAKLDGAAKAFGTKDTPAAKNILRAAANQVGALFKSTRISQATADSLSSLLNAAISSL